MKMAEFISKRKEVLRLNKQQLLKCLEFPCQNVNFNIVPVQIES